MTSLVMRLRHSGRSTFFRAIATLMSGNVFAAAVPILAAPILGRLYDPVDYGALAQYVAPASVLAVLASLQFQHAIIAERTDRAAGQVAWLVLLGSIACGALTAFGVLVLWGSVLSGTATGAWYWLMPLTVTGAGVFAAGSLLANRHRRYGWIARLQMGHVLATVTMSIALGCLGWGADGLLAAYFLGQLVQLGAYLWLLRELRVINLPWPGVARLWVLVQRHRSFATFTLPSEFSGQLNMQAPVFALDALGADATLGAFVRARQLVSLPLTVVSQSVAQVFRREASERYHKFGSCRALILRTAGGLFAIGLGPCLLFMAFAPWLVEVYLGPNWREAGEIARILAPVLLLQVTVSPVSTIYFIAGRQFEDFVLTMVSSALMALIMAVAVYGIGEPEAIVMGFAAVFAVIYAVYFIRSLAIGGGKTR